MQMYFTIFLLLNLSSLNREFRFIFFIPSDLNIVRNYFDNQLILFYSPFDTPWFHDFRPIHWHFEEVSVIWRNLVISLETCRWFSANNHFHIHLFFLILNKFENNALSRRIFLDKFFVIFQFMSDKANFTWLTCWRIYWKTSYFSLK